jgi:hypothetical protein
MASPDHRERPDSAGRKIIHERLLKLVIVDRRSEVAIENLKTAVGGHMEGAPSVLTHPLDRQYLFDRSEKVVYLSA